MRAAYVENGIVVNVVEVVEVEEISGGLVATDTANIGDKYEGVSFLPPEPIPLTKDQEKEKARIEQVLSDIQSIKSDEKIQSLTEMTPDDAKKWIDESVKTLDDVKGVLETLTLSVLLMIKKF